MKPHFARRIILINRTIQLKYFAIFAFVGGGLATLFGFVILMVVHQSDVQQGFVAEGSSMMVASQGLFWWFVLAVVLISALLGLSGMLLTHRIAGPVFVMGRAMNTLAAGKYPTLRPLRKSDDLTELYGSLRALFDSLLKTERAEVATLEKALEMISASDGTGSAAARGLLLEMQLKKHEKMSAVNETSAKR